MLVELKEVQDGSAVSLFIGTTDVRPSPGRRSHVTFHRKLREPVPPPSPPSKTGSHPAWTGKKSIQLKLSGIETSEDGLGLFCIERFKKKSCVCQRERERECFIEFRPSAHSQGGETILCMFILVLHTSCGGAYTQAFFFSLSHSHTHTH